MRTIGEPPRSPTLYVSDILIERVYQIECSDHGIIDQVHTWDDAIHARRVHFFEMHKFQGVQEK